MKKTLIQLHVAVFLWGFTGPLGKLIALPSLSLVWYRIGLALIFLLLAIKIEKVKFSIPKKELKQYYFIGSIIALHWITFFASIKYANVSIALTCLSCSALFTAFIEPFIQQTKINKTEIALGLISIIGMYCIYNFKESYRLGFCLGILSAFLSSLFSTLNKKIISTSIPKVVMLHELFGGFLLLSIWLAINSFYFKQAFELPSFTDWIWLLILSFICTVIAFELSLKALKNISAFTQNLTVNLEPVYGILLSAFLFQENKQLGFLFYVGFTLILSSVVLQVINKKFLSTKRQELT